MGGSRLDVIFLGNELPYLEVIDLYANLTVLVSEEMRGRKARACFGSAYSWAKKKGRRVISPAAFYQQPEKADLYIVSGFSRLIPLRISSVPSLGTINIHQSFLPAYRGRHPLNWVLVNGEKSTGVTIHHVNEKFDDGKIIVQQRVKIAPDDTVLDVQWNTVAAGKKLLKQVFSMIGTREFEGFSQDLSRASYFKSRTPGDGKINWNLPAGTIRNLVRSLVDPYPGAYFYFQGKKIVVDEVAVSGKAPDQSVKIGVPFTRNGKWYVKTGDGLLEVRAIRNKAGFDLFRLPA